MTIVGDVVTLRNQISWKERKPLRQRKFYLQLQQIKSAIKQKLQESGAEIYQIQLSKRIHSNL